MRTHKITLSGLMLCAGLTGVALFNVGCAGTNTHRSTGAYLDDKGINTRVKTALFRDPVVSGFDVHVNSYQGDVQLSGFVDSPEQKERAAEVARTVSGVRMVTNNVEVKPGSAAMGTAGSTVQGSSQTITQPVPEVAPAIPAPRNDTYRPDNSLNAAPVVPDTTVRSVAPVRTTAGPAEPAFNNNVEITSSNGRATVRGNVRTESEKASIERKLRDIPGIDSVDNQLQVLSPR